VFTFNTILQVFFAMILIVHLKKSFSITAASSVINGQNSIAVVNQILYKRVKTLPGLPSGAAMYPDQCRNFIFCRGIFWFVIYCGNFMAVKLRVSYNFCASHILRVAVCV